MPIRVTRGLEVRGKRTHLWPNLSHLEQVLDLRQVEVGDTDESSCPLDRGVSWRNKFLHRFPGGGNVVFWLSVHGSDGKVHECHVEIIQAQLLQIGFVARLDFISVSTNKRARLAQHSSKPSLSPSPRHMAQNLTPSWSLTKGRGGGKD